MSQGQVESFILGVSDLVHAIDRENGSMLREVAR
jgi:hypothetical protein